MFDSQNTTLPSSLQTLSRVVRAFLSELDTDERMDAHAGYTAFLAHFPAAEQADAFAFYWRSYPGFNSFAAEYHANRFARYAALSNCAGTDTPYRWERRAAACSGRRSVNRG